MELIQYLLCVATRHEVAKEEHAEQSNELWQKMKKSRTGQTSYSLTYQDEHELLMEIVASVGKRPTCLKKVTLQAIGALAYIVTAKIANDPCIEGHEIINKLVYDPEKTFLYLQAITELKEKGWVQLIEAPGMAFTDQPPFSYLQSRIELGVQFHKEVMDANAVSRSFISNDAYLDALFLYLQTLINDDCNRYRVQDPEADLTTFQPEGWFRKIVTAVQSSTVALPTAEAQEKHSLSVFQYLALIGLLGTRDGDVSDDFTDTANVTGIFARGRVCRRRMKEHLFGEKSPLKRHRLIEGTSGEFGETIQLSQLGLVALLGRHSSKTTAQELKRRVKKNTLFDFEEPKIQSDSLQLPSMVMEAIRSLIFSESKEGKQIRKSWNSTLPAAWGSPTGSTVLLYGPPGTGKSLTAQYLASELQLPLLKVDASQVLSCWVGDTEKNVRRIFMDYEIIMKEIGSAPVLLLNEADQLLGTRGAGSQAVDKMHNNVQALFLEGLERFAGVLVATTNRKDALDPAFSRRFTYKLELPPPDKELRILLWKNHLPIERLGDEVEIEELAGLGLTGGEIRLVVERVVRLLAYRGATIIDRLTLLQIAREELDSRMTQYGGNKMGFRAENI